MADQKDLDAFVTQVTRPDDFEDFWVDVRTDCARLAQPFEIPGSRWVPLADVAWHAPNLPRDATIVAYCT